MCSSEIPSLVAKKSGARAWGRLSQSVNALGKITWYQTSQKPGLIPTVSNRPVPIRAWTRLSTWHCGAKGAAFALSLSPWKKTHCTVIFDLLISLVVSFPEAYPWEFSAGGFQHFEIILHSVPPSISSLYCGTSNFLPQILCLLQLEHNLDITITALV